MSALFLFLFLSGKAGAGDAGGGRFGTPGSRHIVNRKKSAAIPYMPSAARVMCRPSRACIPGATSQKKRPGITRKKIHAPMQTCLTAPKPKQQ